MRRISNIALSALVLSATCLPGLARANTNDIQAFRLGSPATDFEGANGRYRLLSTDLAMAFTPTPMHPAETLGRSGASMEVGMRMAQVHADARVEGNGTCNNSADNCRVWVTEGNVESLFLMPMVQVRKGLPFSFEFETKFQYLIHSEMFAATAGLRWSLNEGFDFLPDVSVGGQGTRVMGVREIGIITGALDVTVGKWFSLGGMAVLAPYAGWQRVWVSAISEVIDFDPANELLDNATADDTIFEDVLIGGNYFDRFFVGFRFNAYVVQVSGEFTYQPAHKVSAASVSTGNPGFPDQGATMTFATKLGLDF
ncbi:MAG: hypothetical protein P1V51_14940 [Deltaproteobacteria bacterium]|nr:hypothetical protein [Deltaproteobacteria bacterium]